MVDYHYTYPVVFYLVDGWSNQIKDKYHQKHV